MLVLWVSQCCDELLLYNVVIIVVFCLLNFYLLEAQGFFFSFFNLFFCKFSV